MTDTLHLACNCGTAGTGVGGDFYGLGLGWIVCQIEGTSLDGSVELHFC